MDLLKPLPTFLHNSLLWESVRENNDGDEPTYTDFDITDLRNKGLFKDDDVIMEMHDFAVLLQTCEYFGTTDYPKTFYDYALRNKETVLDFLDKHITDMPETNCAKLVEFRDELEKTSLHYNLHYAFEIQPTIFNNKKLQEFGHQLILLFVCDNLIVRKVIFGIKDNILINKESAIVHYIAEAHESCTIDLLINAIEKNGMYENFNVFFQNNCLRIGNGYGETRFYVTKFNRDAVLQMFREIQQTMLNLPKSHECPLAGNVETNGNILKHIQHILTTYKIIKKDVPCGSYSNNGCNTCFLHSTSYKKFKFENTTSFLNKINNSIEKQNTITDLGETHFVELVKEFLILTNNNVQILINTIDGVDSYYTYLHYFDDNLLPIEEID